MRRNELEGRIRGLVCSVESPQKFATDRVYVSVGYLSILVFTRLFQVF